jgi:hypothetical protein
VAAQWPDVDQRDPDDAAQTRLGTQRRLFIARSI